MGKEDEARFAPGLQPWYQPLRELGGLPRQFEGSGLEKQPKEEVRKACQVYLRFLKEEGYSQAGFKRAAELGTEVLRLADGWEEACRALRRTWIEDQGDHFQQLHGSFFEGLVDDELLAKARRNAIEGIEAHSTSESCERMRCSPHPSLRDHLEEAAAQLWKDAAKGRALVCFDMGDSTPSGGDLRPNGKGSEDVAGQDGVGQRAHHMGRYAHQQDMSQGKASTGAPAEALRGRQGYPLVEAEVPRGCQSF